MNGLEKFRKGWTPYAIVFILSAAAHFLLFVRTGANPSSDYHVVYHPEALRLVEWMKGAGPFPSVSPYQISHMGYVFFISLVYIFWGTENLVALSVIQILISIPSFMVILHISLKKYRSRTIALFFTCISLLFLENIQWAVWTVPDSLYRALFIPVYFILLELYDRRRDAAFLLTAVIASMALLFIRIDTVLLFLPVYWLGLKIIWAHVRGRTAFVLAALAASGAMLWLLMPVILKVIGIAGYWYHEGWVMPGTDHHVPGITQIEPIDLGRAHEFAYAAGRQIKLMGLRLYQFFNVLPPFWSTAHKAYYAVHMIPFYILSAVGVIRALKTRDRYFIIFFMVYLCSMLTHTLTFVDAAKRQMYSVLPFFIMFAGYGFDYLAAARPRRFPRGSDQ